MISSFLPKRFASSTAVRSAPNDWGLPSTPTSTVSRSGSSAAGTCLTTQTSRLVSPGHAGADRADLAVAWCGRCRARRAPPGRSPTVLDLAQQLGRVLAVHHLPLERDAGRLAALVEVVQIAVRDQLEPHGDQAVVDLALPRQLLLDQVLLGQRVLHLLEAVVVHARGVDVAAGQLRTEGRAQRDGTVGGAVRVRRVVDGHEDLLVHRGLLTFDRGHSRSRLGRSSTGTAAVRAARRRTQRTSNSSAASTPAPASTIGTTGDGAASGGT